MATVDAALCKFSGSAEVWTLVATRQTARVTARSAHHRDDEITRLQVFDAFADLHDLTEHLVPDHEMSLAWRRLPILESCNLTIGSANADLENLYADIAIALETRGWKIDQAEFLFRRDHSHCTHCL